MGQQEIIELLEKQTEPLSRSQICNFLGEPGSKISHIINKLLEQGEVKSIEIDRNKAKEIFGDDAPCRKLKMYFIENKNRNVHIDIKKLRFGTYGIKRTELTAEERRIKQKEYMKEMREAANLLGNCISCFKEKESIKFKTCSKCRENRKKYYKSH